MAFLSDSKNQIYGRSVALNFIFLFLVMIHSFALGEPSGGAEALGKTIDEKVASAKQYTVEQKKLIQDDFENQLKALDRDINTLNSKINDTQKKASQRLKSEWQEQVDFLESRKVQISKDLKSLSASTGNAWDELHQGIQDAFSSLKKSLKKAKAELKK